MDFKKEYHKIRNLYKRNPDDNYESLLIGQFDRPEFQFLQTCNWIGTEKVDGTNIRVGWNGQKVSFSGKTENAQIPEHLMQELFEMFPKEKLAKCFSSTDEWDNDTESGYCLYGEGYGVKIQKGGGLYISKSCSFILFDVAYNGMFLERENVRDIANKLKIEVVPVRAVSNLRSLTEFVKKGFNSGVSEAIREAEGLVIRPETELLDRSGKRIIAKLKTKELQKS